MKPGVPVAKAAGRTVYIVDGDAAVRDSLTALLEAEGYGTRAFNTYQSFSEGCHPATASCLLLDWQPPRYGGDGIADLARLMHRLPVIVMSGAGARARNFAIRNGATAFFEKPLDSDELVRKLREILG